MDRVNYLNPEGLHRNPAFSQVVTVEGSMKTVYVGGQNAVDASGTIVGKGDIGAQAEQVVRNLKIALQSAGASIDQVIKWNVYIIQGQPLEPAYKAFMRAWGPVQNPPIITLLFVSGLANPDFLLEVDVVAVFSADI
jgi:enamine deaminase RidA (YjgF/YER057c/UK114 family)